MTERDYFAGLTPSADLPQAIRLFLEPRLPETWRHVQRVAAEAVKLAERFGADTDAARLAGLAHDLAAVAPRAEIIAVAEAWGVSLSAADRQIPQVVHGPLAATVLARRLGVRDSSILDAVRYHTVLRPRAALLDKIVFIADKVAFDPTTPRVDYEQAVQEGLERSLDAGVWAYLDFVVTHQAELGWKLHPLLLAAHQELRSGKSGNGQD